MAHAQSLREYNQQQQAVEYLFTHIPPEQKKNRKLSVVSAMGRRR